MALEEEGEQPPIPARLSERRKHLDLAQQRMASRHARIVADEPSVPHSAWRRFVLQFGWRAYALPVLVIVTVLALVSTNNGSVRRTLVGGSSPRTAPANIPPTAAPSTQISADDPGGSVNNEVLASDALPAGAAYPKIGTGTFHTVAGHTGVFGTGPLLKFSIEVEDGMGYTAAQGSTFAAVVMQTLTNPKSWISGHNVSLQRVDSGPVNFHVDLTSSMTVRSLCGYDIQIETSCYAPEHESRVVLNIARWVRGDAQYFGDLPSYHQYMVNHETGHALGHAHAHQCLANGLAPVMMQQTIGLKTATGRCRPNQWPYPTGAADAPGTEQPAAEADQAFVQLNA